jgi:hypothetical protein
MGVLAGRILLRLAGLAMAALVGCGARTGFSELLGGTPLDAGSDAPSSSGPDAAADAGTDAMSVLPPDGGVTPGEVCSPDGWCWKNPLPQGNPLSSVWGSGPSDVWAVGEETILHYDGTTWTGQVTGALGGFSSVWVSGSSDVWAGAYQTILHFVG